MRSRLSRVGLVAIPLWITACADDISGQIPTESGGTGSAGSTSGMPMADSTMSSITEPPGSGAGSAESGQVDSASSTTSSSGPTTTLSGTSESSGPGTMTGSSSSGGPDDGNCCEPHVALGCDVPAVENCVCGLDPFCCSAEWDQICVDEAIDECGAQCPGGGSGSGSSSGGGSSSSDGGASSGTGMSMGGDCCASNGSPGCDDPACEAVVCATDPFCCSVEWDGICGDQGVMLCAACGASTGGSSGSSGGSGGTDGDCCMANGSPGCDDPGCEGIVCGVDPFCCSVQWDLACGNEAQAMCPATCGGGSSGSSGGSGGSGGMGGDCCMASELPGCDDPACEVAVCTVDPFCCSGAWDQICANEAQVECPMLCPGGGSSGSGGSGGDGDCCMGNGTPGCDDAVCEGLVCMVDPFCCSVTWDDICAGHALMECALCGGGSGGMGTSDCCMANGSPGCDDAACEVAVCTVDPFCCDTEWDQICADQAQTQCPALCP